MIIRLRRVLADREGARGAAAVALALTGLLLLYDSTAREVTIAYGGESLRVTSHARTVEAVLHEAGLSPEDGDRVFPPLDTPLKDRSTIELQRARRVHLQVDSVDRWIRTTAQVPSNMLMEAGERIFPGDRVWVDGIPVQDPSLALPAVPSRIRLERGSTIEIQWDDSTIFLNGSTSTLGQAAWEAGWTTYEADRISSDLNASPDLQAGIRVQPSRPVRILADGKEVTARSAGTTVGEALAQVGLAPVGLDYTVPSMGEAIPADGTIRLVRVREEVLVEQKPIPFDTVYEAMPEEEIDTLRLVKAGAYGVGAARVRVRYADGEEIERISEGEWVAREPTPEVMGYGTKIVIRVVQTPDGPLEYWRAVTMYATSYSPSREGLTPDARNYGITASGLPVGFGNVAIDRRYIPFFTRMYVPGYGFAVAADTGSGVKGRWIDLGYDDDNYVGWHQNVTVYFLTPVPPESSIVWVFP
jgi:uncharacterized protein YabE (DUF348 family)